MRERYPLREAFDILRDGDLAHLHHLLLDFPDLFEREKKLCETPDDGLPFSRGARLTLLIRAAELGRTEFVQFLLPHSNPLLCNENGSALQAALRHAQADCVALLLPISNPRQTDALGHDALMTAAISPQTSEPHFQELMQRCDLMAHNIYHETALFLAAQKGRLHHVQRLLPRSNPRMTNNRGWDAFAVALEHGHEAVALELLPHVNPKQRYTKTDGFHQTPLMLAAMQSRRVFDALLPHSDPNAQDAKGNTALIKAAIYGQAHCLAALLPLTTVADSPTSGPIWFQASHSRGPLWCAAINANPSCVALLLPPPGRPFSHNHDGTSLFKELMTLIDGHVDQDDLWKCLDLLAPYASRPLALRLLETSSTQRMPRFSALLEREKLQLALGDSQTPSPPASSSWTSANRGSTTAQRSVAGGVLSKRSAPRI